MTLEEQIRPHTQYWDCYNDEPLVYNHTGKVLKIVNLFAIGFTDWKDDNFSMYGDKTYYAKTSSQYFDITKYIGKEKPTKYYTTKELFEIYKKEKGL
jgi:hypothetical protein